MRKLLAPLVFACSVTVLASCAALSTLSTATLAARNFAFTYKRFPGHIHVPGLREDMEILIGPDTGVLHSGWVAADGALHIGAEGYSGNKQGNQITFSLQTIPQGMQHSFLKADARDLITNHTSITGHIGATGAIIQLFPMPTVGDTITDGEFSLFVTDDGAAEVSTEYTLFNDPANRYFRFVLTSVDTTRHVATAWFQAIVVAQSGPHAGTIFAVTEGEFVMDLPP